jgi:hypothetical protein
MGLLSYDFLLNGNLAFGDKDIGWTAFGKQKTENRSSQLSGE